MFNSTHQHISQLWMKFFNLFWIWLLTYTSNMCIYGNVMQGVTVTLKLTEWCGLIAETVIWSHRVQMQNQHWYSSALLVHAYISYNWWKVVVIYSDHSSGALFCISYRCAVMILRLCVLSRCCAHCGPNTTSQLPVCASLHLTSHLLFWKSSLMTTCPVFYLLFSQRCQLEPN